jgi:hypothetical protein
VQICQNPAVGFGQIMEHLSQLRPTPAKFSQDVRSAPTCLYDIQRVYPYRRLARGACLFSTNPEDSARTSAVPSAS